MATNPKTPAKKGTTAVAPPTPDWGGFEGEGFENQTGADIQIPFLGILQPLSPQVADDDRKLPGAKPGKLFNTVTNEVYPGDVFIIPCYTERLFVEWVPRNSGGGFVGTHMPDSDVVSAAREKAKKFNELTHGENELKETFYMYCLVIDDPEATTEAEFVVIAFSSTGIGRYKKLQTQMRTIKGSPPIFANRLKITTTKEKNDQGIWYNWQFDPAIGDKVKDSLLPPPDKDGKVHPLLNAGRELRKLVIDGMARAAFETQKGGGGEGDVPLDEDGNPVF